MADNFDVTRAISSLDALSLLCQLLPAGHEAEVAQNVEALRRDLSAADEQIRQLVRALRDETEPPTFMGEPVSLTDMQKLRNIRNALYTEQLRNALQTLLDLCAIGDVDENTEAHGWGDAIKSAKILLAADEAVTDGVRENGK